MCLWLRATRLRWIALAASGARPQTWDWGGHSLYFRDPAGNSVEIVEGEAFPTVSRRPPAAETK